MSNEEITETSTNFQFSELSTTDLDRPFDGVSAGTFTDMYGREVKISAGDLEEIVKNTNALIGTTTSESGELTGLPIDSKQHDKGDASGWIMAVEAAGNLIRIVPQWTTLGRRLIGEKIQRYFSATLDLGKKVILGGTLTNWPATRDGKTGRVLLRPIELSSGLYSLNEEAGDEPPENHEERNMSDEVKVSESTLAELRETIRREVLAELAPAKGDETAEQAVARLKDQLNLSAFADVADLSKARETMLSQMQGALKAEYERMQKQAGTMLAEMMGQIKREQHIGELAAFLSGGDEKHPRGLPVGREEIETFLSDLSDKQRAAAESILRRTVESGLVEFSEYGHGKANKQGTEKLDEPLARLLREHVKNGGELAAWFDLAGVGEMSRYDLSEFEKEK